MTARLCFIVLAFLLATFADVIQGIVITAPTPNSVIYAGSIFQVKWSSLKAGVDMVSIDLYTGSSAAALQRVDNIGTGIGSMGSSPVIMPFSIPSGNNYYIRVADADVSGTEAAVVGPLTVATSGATTSAPSFSFPSIPGFPSIGLPTVSSVSSLPTSLSSATSGVTSVSSSAGTGQTTSTTTAPPRRTTLSTDTANGDDGGSGLSSGAIAGIAIGSAAAAGLAFGLVMCLRRGSRDNGDEYKESKYNADNDLGTNVVYADTSRPSPPVPQEGNTQTVAVQYYPENNTSQQPYYNAPSGGAYYEAGHGDHGYYYGTPVPTSQDVSASQYSGYGYHPAAVYTPQVSTDNMPNPPSSAYTGYPPQQPQQQPWPTMPMPQPPTPLNPQNQQQPYYPPAH